MTKKDELFSKIIQARKRKKSQIMVSYFKNKLDSFYLEKKYDDFEIIKDSIFLSGGIGDIFAVESFLTDKERNKISSIFYATSKQAIIQELFNSLSWPKLKNHITVWDDFSDFWCFYTADECISKLSKTRQPFNEIKKAKDLSIFIVFDEIKKGNLKYNGSSFLNQKIATIKKFDLPNNYVVISPYSTDKRLIGRDFVKQDWDNCLDYLTHTNLNGVIINSGNDFVPNGVLNLSNKTSVTEAVEILKSAKGYVGIDSWLSVLAAKLFNPPYLQIKSVNKHCYSNADCYYAPQTDFSFIVKEINAY
jgi:hypothetical protein